MGATQLNAEQIAKALSCGERGCPCGRRSGKELLTHCPAHADDRPSLTITEDNGRLLVKCHAGCSQGAVLEALKAQSLWPDSHRDGRSQIVATYVYRDEGGNPLFEVCRTADKRFLQRRPGSADWGIEGIRRVLYRLPELLAADPETLVFVCEGEKDADNLAALGLVATTNPGGARKWRQEYAESLRGRKMVILPDNDAPGRDHAAQVAASLRGVAKQAMVLELPGLLEKQDVSDWLDAGGTPEELLEMAHPPPAFAGTLSISESEPDSEKSATAALAEVEGAFRKRLLMPDAGALRFVLAVLAADALEGDPVWGLVVAPPSGTKTEIIRALEGVPKVFPLSELTARTFASGLEGGQREPSLLPRLSDHVLTLKDFTTVLTLHHDERLAIFAQLREIYDGRFDKVWGTGKELHWRGRLGLIAGVTQYIDATYAMHQILGERFVLYRAAMPDRREMARAAMRGRGKEGSMRQELRSVVGRFVAGLPDTPAALGEEHTDKIASLADFTSTARSGVLRDRRSRDLSFAPEPEAPARLAKQLASLAVGHAMIRGVPVVEDEDYGFVLKVARDCINAMRLVVIGALGDDYTKTSKIAERVKYPTTTVRRTLKDLAALDVVEISKADRQGQADHWALSEWAQDRLSHALSFESAPDSEERSVPATAGEGCVRQAEQPEKRCHACGGTDFWGKRGDTCRTCHPPPKSGHLVQAALEMGATVAEP